MNRCFVRKIPVPPALDGDYDSSPGWTEAEEIIPAIRMFPRYSLFRRLFRRISGAEKREKFDPYSPETGLKLLHDGKHLYGLFRVKDQYVRATSSHFGEPACIDSCVEFFIRPAGELRYFNFEFTAGGHLLLFHIEKLRKGVFSPVAEEDCNGIKRVHSLPSKIDPEITDPVVWTLGFTIPVSLFVKYGDNVNPDLSGQIWTANVYKCGDRTSHPHWFTWQPLPELDFHHPECFGEIEFE